MTCPYMYKVLRAGSKGNLILGGLNVGTFLTDGSIKSSIHQKPKRAWLRNFANMWAIDFTTSVQNLNFRIGWVKKLFWIKNKI